MNIKYQIPLFAAGIALGAPGYAMEHDNEGAEVSASAGIADGSATGAVDENAANLTRAHGASAVGAAYSEPGGSFGSPRLAAGALYGNGTFGLAAGVTHDTNGEGSTGAYYGLGVRAESIETSFGVSGHTPVSPGGDSSFDLGVRTQASSQLAVSAVAYGLGDGAQVYGAGLAYQPDKSFSLVSDFSSSKDLNNFQAQPGFAVHSEQASLTVSYGFRLDRSRAFVGPLSDGWSLGAGLKPTRNFGLELYYNHLSKYAVVLSATF